jgi:hypothetical protein
MKENAPVGTTWESTEFIGAQSGTSLSLKLKYSFAITAVGATRVVNGKTYNNVTTVVWSSLSNVDNAGYTTDLDFESYYAKGVGLIEFRAKPAGSTTWPFIEMLRNY